MAIRADGLEPKPITIVNYNFSQSQQKTTKKNRTWAKTMNQNYK